MKYIVTIQHTQSVHHTNGMVGSWTDWDLTDLGKEQADAIGKKLKEAFAEKDVIIYSSDLKRAKQTAEEITKYLGIEPIFKQELRERNLGKCCGKSVQWLRENIECPEKTVDDRLFSDGESRREAWNRLRPFYEEVMASEDGNIIIVSHGDLLSIWNAMFIGIPVESLMEVDIHGPGGGVSHMFVGDDGKHMVRHINDMSYMV
ncbi:histidine phosphatase family protein [Eubacterium sp.]|uniref:histidine phosphatase family protein n=1 Tax=Eubacterium sp. TaxID=142586 RepID=UPI0025F84EFC|nr:histidine phosphatase family protein [Eubacterium sp.]MCR5630045.1 phosphoglycerate mutase family protein [Eubacterium sp.]